MVVLSEQLSSVSAGPQVLLPAASVCELDRGAACSLLDHLREVVNSPGMPGGHSFEAASVRAQITIAELDISARERDGKLSGQIVLLKDVETREFQIESGSFSLKMAPNLLTGDVVQQGRVCGSVTVLRMLNEGLASDLALMAVFLPR